MAHPETPPTKKLGSTDNWSTPPSADDFEGSPVKKPKKATTPRTPLSPASANTRRALPGAGAGALVLSTERGSENYKITHDQLQPQEVLMDRTGPITPPRAPGKMAEAPDTPEIDPDLYDFCSPVAPSKKLRAPLTPTSTNPTGREGSPRTPQRKRRRQAPATQILSPWDINSPRQTRPSTEEVDPGKLLRYLVCLI